MQTQKQEQKPQNTQGRSSKSKRFWFIVVCIGVIYISILIAGFLFIRSAGSSLYNIMYAFFTILTLIVGLVSLIYVMFSSKGEPTNIFHYHIQPHVPQTSPPEANKLSASAETQPPAADQKDSTAPGHNKSKVIATPPISIFPFNKPHLPASGEFYGRARERIILLDRTHKEASTSIVGPRRIGKTWFIDYLHLIAPVELDTNFQLARLDGTMPSCKTVADFTMKALEAFGVPSTFLSDRANMGLDRLSNFVNDLKSKHITPVLCIDEFEGFFNHQDFDCEFYANLRYIASNGLVLVIASKDPLIELVGERCKTSGFFNIFHQLTLKPFDKEEAQEFVQAKGKEAGFTADERGYLLKYGQASNEEQQLWPPLRLQLAGKMLLTDKNLAQEGKPRYYRPTEAGYWREFEQRLQETYRGAVR